MWQLLNLNMMKLYLMQLTLFVISTFKNFNKLTLMQLKLKDVTIMRVV